MSGSWRRFFLAVLLIVFPLSVSLAEEPSGEIDSSLVIEQFDVFTDGDDLLVPVDVGGDRYLFSIDTGCSVSGCDTALRPLLGDARGTKKITTPSGSTTVEFYDAPNARLGKLDLRISTPIACFDFQKMREVSGHDFYGVIGMDVLGSQVVRLDSDAGKLMILRSPSKGPGESLPLTYSGHVPFVAIDIPACGKLLFTIDTGCVSRDSGLIDAGNFDYSVLSGVGKPSAKSLFLDAAGTSVLRQMLFEKLLIGDFECQRVFMGQAKVRRFLSLRFLTRFNVTFDFPRKQVYLEKSRYFNRPDRCDLSGLHFLRRNGQMLVDAVDEQSPAASCGIEPGDFILSVNGKNAADLRAFPIRELLSIPGTTVQLTLQRGDRFFDAELDRFFEVELKLPEEEQWSEPKQASKSMR